jgi:hypothetical protein
MKLTKQVSALTMAAATDGGRGQHRDHRFEKPRMFAKTVTTRARRILMVLGTLGLVAAVWAPARAGAQPSPPTPVTVTYTFGPTPGTDFGDLCGFNGQIALRGKAATLLLPNGIVIATSPTLTATVTNLETRAHVDLNIPGPVRTTLGPTGEVVKAVFLGPSLVIRSPMFGDTTNGLVYVTGRYTFLPRSEPRFSGVGTLTDICALLA